MLTPPETSGRAEDAIPLWHELGMLYAVAGEDGRRSWMLGFVIACVAGAQVLLSAPLFGTAWAGPFAAAIPVASGLLAGGGSLAWRRGRFSKRRGSLARALAERGEDARRPTARGLGAYYDAQLILLRSEYEYWCCGAVAPRRARPGSCRGFGFAPEDGFECGPLNVSPDTEGMRSLREGWETRLALGRHEVPALALREDRAYRVFPREMTVPMELATRKAYLSVSCRMLRERHGKGQVNVPKDVRVRARRDLHEYATLVRKM